MRKRLHGDLSLYSTQQFPKFFGSSRKRYKVTLGIGGNLGDTKRVFEKLLVALGRSRFVDVVQTAPILKNPPFGYLKQPYFYNSVVIVHTNMMPKPFLRFVLRLEKRFKRKKLQFSF